MSISGKTENEEQLTSAVISEKLKHMLFQTRSVSLYQKIHHPSSIPNTSNWISKPIISLVTKNLYTLTYSNLFYCLWTNQNTMKSVPDFIKL